jgi:hypothetical protein
MKSLAFLFLLLLIVPGSGQLIWDGIPFNTRAEVGTIALTVVAIFSREFRQRARAWLNSFRWEGLLRPSLVFLCLLKFLSFAWFPMSQGFESCYRSLFNPIENPKQCEKSYDDPFLRANGLPLDNTSRIDPVVDFGEYIYDWSLPFMNEYPRLGDLWLERFPFEATYFARVENREEKQWLPIYGIGEIEADINGVPAFRAVEYERSFLRAVPLRPESSELLVRYRYRDEESSNPETRPEPRGPYAQLKVGEPMTTADLIEISRIRVTGVVGNLERSQLAQLMIRDRGGKVVDFINVNAQREASQENNELLRTFDFEIEIPASSLTNAPLRITTSDGAELGVVTKNPADPLTPGIQQGLDSIDRIALSVGLTTDRDSLSALRPDVNETSSAIFHALLAFLDTSMLLMLVALGTLSALFLRREIPWIVGLSAGAWLAVEPLDAVLPSFVGAGRELVVPYLLVALFVVVLRNKITKHPLAYLFPISIILAAQKVFEHLHYNHPGHRPHWWGNLLYYWRDSDWFANNGYARTIFVEGSLRGGEPVFWFQSAPRYLALIARYLFGENDVLIGLIAVSVGFLSLCALGARFASRSPSLSSRALATVAVFIGLIFLGDQMIVALGFFVASEYPTWITMLGVTTFLLGPRRETRIWVTTSLAAVLATMVHFRPNTLFVSVTLFLLMLTFKIDRQSREAVARQTGWAGTVYLLVLSLSLLHNLYYGDSFVPFTTNASINYAFSWTEVWGQEGIGGSIAIIWGQLSALMYWRVPNDPSYAVVFWGAQATFAIALFERARSKHLWSPATVFAILPFTYIVPMLKFQYTSYFPRHLVAASLLCLCSALLIWPRVVHHRIQE